MFLIKICNLNKTERFCKIIFGEKMKFVSGKKNHSGRSKTFGFLPAAAAAAAFWGEGSQGGSLSRPPSSLHEIPENDPPRIRVQYSVINREKVEVFKLETSFRGIDV